MEGGKIRSMLLEGRVDICLVYFSSFSEDLHIRMYSQPTWSHIQTN
jgi:hypothetical protein